MFVRRDEMVKILIKNKNIAYLLSVGKLDLIDLQKLTNTITRTTIAIDFIEFCFNNDTILNLLKMNRATSAQVCDAMVDLMDKELLSSEYNPSYLMTVLSRLPSFEDRTKVDKSKCTVL